MTSLNVTLWIAEGCNLACDYCYEGNEKGNRVMSLDTAIRTLSFLRKQCAQIKAHRLIVRFHGGEPLLNIPVMQMIVEDLRRNPPVNEIGFTLTTNATCITQDILDFFVQNACEIHISIDGCEASNDKHRVDKNGVGTYNAVMKNSRQILEKQPNTCARMTVTPDTINFLATNIEHLLSIGFKKIICQLDTCITHWETVDNVETILSREAKKAAIMLSKRSDKNQIGISLVNAAEQALKKNAICLGGIDTVNITVDGKIYPCIKVVGFPKYYLGTVDSAINRDLLHEIQKMSQNISPCCTGCVRANYCSGSHCKLINEADTGIENVPSPLVCLMENVKVSTNHYYRSLLSRAQ